MSQTNPLFDGDERLTIDIDSGIPLYRQVEERLATRIGESGKPDSLIPTEDELAALFGVSRITIRRAVAALVAKGMLVRRRGVGTRILRTKMVEDLGRLRGYTEEAERAGFEVVTKVLRVRAVLPRREVVEALRLAPGETALRVDRVRGTNAAFPVTLLESYFPPQLGLRESDDFSRSAYDLVTKRHQVPILWARQRITAANATRAEARLLRVKPGAAILVFFRTTYTIGDTPIEFTRGVFNPKLYSFSISMQR